MKSRVNSSTSLAGNSLERCNESDYFHVCPEYTRNGRYVEDHVNKSKLISSKIRTSWNVRRGKLSKEVNNPAWRNNSVDGTVLR